MDYSEPDEEIVDFFLLLRLPPPHEEADEAVRAALASPLAARLVAATDGAGLPALAVALRHDRVAAAEALLDAGADLFHAREQISSYAVDVGFARDRPAWAWARSAAAVRMAVARGADPNRPCAGHAPLLLAAREGHAGAVEALLEAGARVDEEDPGAVWAHVYQPRRLPGVGTALCAALCAVAGGGHRDAARLLLDSGAAAGREGSWSALACAAYGGDADTVRSLLARGAAPGGVPGQARPLTVAASRNHADVVRALIEAGADPLAAPPHNGGGDQSEAVLEAASRGAAAALEALLEGPARGSNLKVPLARAADGGHAACMRLLLRAGARPAARHVRWMPMHSRDRETTAQAVACVRELLDAGLVVGADELAAGVCTRSPEMLALLLDRGAVTPTTATEALRALLSKDLVMPPERMETVWEAHDVRHMAGLARALIDRAGADPSAVDLASQNTPAELVAAAVRAGAPRGSTRKVALRRAVEAGAAWAVEEELRAAREASSGGGAASGFGKPFLQRLLSAAGSGGAVEALLRAGATVAHRDPDDGATALHRAAGRGCAGVVRALLDAGADPNAADGEGDTPLVWACEFGAGECVELLLAGGARLSGRGTELMSALESEGIVREPRGAERAALALVRAGASTGATGYRGHTPLHVAVQRMPRGSPLVVELLRAGADPRACDRYGRTPLSSTLLDTCLNAGRDAVAIVRAAGGSVDAYLPRNAAGGAWLPLGGEPDSCGVVGHQVLVPLLLAGVRPWPGLASPEARLWLWRAHPAQLERAELVRVLLRDCGPSMPVDVADIAGDYVHVARRAW